VVAIRVAVVIDRAPEKPCKGGALFVGKIVQHGFLI
jgi:hypothetical protein